jgi:beta-phosphoglucomutase
MKIKTFIFDLDGVITNTAKYHYLAWKKIADENNIPFGEKENDTLRGVSRQESLELLLGEKIKMYTTDDFNQMLTKKNKYYQTYLEEISESDFLPGSKELLMELKNLGFKIAIGSSSKNTMKVLEQLGIYDFFDAVSDGFSVIHNKPAPDIFLDAAQKTHSIPSQCVVFEDANVGVQAAIAAKMFVVGIGPIERVGQANVIFPTMASVDLEYIYSEFKKQHNS